MSSGIFGIGISALQTAQLGLATTGHNISNANTEGYNRQRIIQAANLTTASGAGYVGTGVHVSTIDRIYDSFLAKQVANAQTSVSALEAYSSVLGELNMLLADKDAGLGAAMEGFFAGINQVAANPSSLVTRQTMVSNAQSLVSRFRILNGQLEEQYQNTNSQIQSHVDAINSYGQQIAKVNRQIMDAEAIARQPPNDLYDQRDQLVAELNKHVGVQTSLNSNGTMNVFLGNGQQLVVNTTATTLVAIASSGDPSRLTVGTVTIGGTLELPESLISGGALSGVLQYRAESLDAAANSLGRIAASMALVFNAQHALGQDLLGKIHGEAGFVDDFFKLGAPSVVANTNNPAGASTVTASYLPASRSNDGTFFTNLTNSDYRLHYDGTGYTLTRLSDNATWNDTSIANLNAAIGDQGFQLAESGTAIAGSTYLIQPTRNAARDISVNPVIAADVRQIAVATPVLAQTPLSNTGTATISAGSVAPGYTLSNIPVTLSYNSGNMTGFPPGSDVTRTVDGTDIVYPAGTSVDYSNGATYTFDGISVTISGSPQDGDTFGITRNSNGVSDNRNALLMSQLQTGKTMASNSASFSTVYSQLISTAGNKGGEINTVLAAQQTVLNEAQEARDSLSGVNVDEEAVNLIRYQQSYQAAAKMLQIGSELFASILAIR
jgi:flagellar hook-associated protein 1 FlgK